MNAVNLTGVLARDPILRYRDGRPRAMLDVTTFARKKDSGGKWLAAPTTIPVLVGESSAERVAGRFMAGARVEITGQLKSMKIETPDGPVSVPAVEALTVNPAFEVKKR